VNFQVRKTFDGNVFPLDPNILFLQCTRFTIFSDSLSSIKAVEVGRCRSRPNLFNDALEAMSRTDAETALVWVPSHIGIEGNEKADRLANAALDSETIELDIGLELGDEFSAVDRFVLEKWQKFWENETTGAFYRRLEPRVDRREILRFGSRAAETMAFRLRSGKCALNANLFAMRCHDTGLCDACGVPETVQHFLLECSSELVTGVRRLCSTLELPHTLESVLGNAGVLKYVHSATDRRL
jgi:hypothetical protein